jgi:hypothetical protein
VAPAIAADRLVGQAHVLDGGTIVVAGVHVRPRGVAAPALPDTGSAEARAFTVWLGGGQLVMCEGEARGSQCRAWLYDVQDVIE